MKITKSFVAIAAVSALLILSATPASATAHDIAVTGGTINTTTLGSYPIGPTGTTRPCTNFDTDTDTIAIDETGTGTPTATAVTAVIITSSTTLFGGSSGTPYEVLITKHTGTNTGTISSAGAVTQSVSLRVEFKTVTGAPTCTSTGTPVCTVQANGTLTGTVTAHPLTASATGTLSGSLNVTSIFPLSCTAPWATLVGTTVTLTSLTLHVAT